MSSNITSKVVCVNLRKTCLGTSFVDSTLTARLREATGAAEKKVKGSKKILGDALTPIRALQRGVGEFVKDNSLPGISDDLRIITPKLLSRVRDEVAAAEEKIAAEVAKFSETVVFAPVDPKTGSLPYEPREMSRWEALQEQDKLDLKEAFDPSDYPPLENLEQFFTLRLTVCDLPSGDYFRVEGLTDEMVGKLKSDHEKMLEKVSAAARNEVQKKTLKMVQHIVEKLSDPNAQKLYDSTFDNLREYIKQVPELNISNDSELEELRKLCEQQLDYTSDQIKASRVLKEQAVEAGKAILSKFGGGNRKVLVTAPTTTESA